MGGFETGHILSAVFLGFIALILLLSLGGQRLRANMQAAATWALIFLVTVAGFGIWDDIKGQQRQSVFTDQGRIELERHRDGHYYITLDVNGAPVPFVVDTGASEIVLTMQDAQRAGLDLDELRFLGRASTANGEVRTAPVRLDEVAIGGIRDGDVTAFVNEGEMSQSLLGMAYLNRWDRIEISDGTLVLIRE
ncbi:TIGR02281 family clan AA aspartic protease [Aliishimia ponticola]|uniref:TIGR02281 family clan AA aspartic protease n=1 Tax=Aliishimia ponticola TaxID=2499833 RepID=A0A4S4NJK7_9RHOB|nr:TIGR02281 family clan AA aspartic protease [Aliishimia ponticola]THH38448.1 TIGR02281 family clan AA aspartic protease [Aliishimia ponticola]